MSNIKDQYVDELGSDVGDAFYQLHRNWLETYVRFEEYRILFNEKDNFNLLYAIGSQVFRIIQLVMQDSFDSSNYPLNRSTWNW